MLRQGLVIKIFMGGGRGSLRRQQEQELSDQYNSIGLFACQNRFYGTTS